MGETLPGTPNPFSRFHLFPAGTRARARRRRSTVEASSTGWIARVRSLTATGLIELGEFARFTVSVIIALPAVLMHGTRRRELVTQLDYIGVGALPITHITGLVAGLLMGAQTRTSLRQFGITSIFAQMLTLALIREVGPTFVSLISGARAASGVASELATMSVTQQVDALRALRRNPIESLAAPRTFACIVAFPMLAIVGVLAGMFGGMLIGQTLQQPYLYFFNQAMTILSIREIFPNLIVKPALFGLLIGIVSSYRGLRAEGGTRAVGFSTVRAVVVVTVGVLISDYLVGEFFRHIWPPPPW